MPSQDVVLRIDRVKDALNGKGFEGIYATHYDNIPSRLLVLHDDHGRVAHGEDEVMAKIIEEASDEASLWSALKDSGMDRTAGATRS